MSITVGLPAALDITATPLQNGVLNQFYSQTVQATGGSGTRNWSFQGGNIPNLAINQLTGVISGNPTPTGQFTFTVQVTDALFTDTQDFTITIIAPPAPQITTSSLPTGTVNVPYPSTTLTATGGAPPLIWQPVGMPFGLTFTAATATISGSPTSNGTQNVTFNVNDSTVPFNQTGTRTLSLTVNAEVTIDTTSPLPAGTVGQPYTPVQLVASGGAPPYTWSITGTGQPDQAAPGLTLSLDGVIGGGGQTPTTADSFTRTYRVEDSNGVPFTKSLTLNVNAALTINNTSLPAGQVNVDYGPFTLTASGGTPPYTWSTVTTPVLPADLIITPVGDTATISGKPTATETNMDHTFTVTDSTNFSVDKALSLTIDP
ncbi:MAG TPA: putative Ig domain-containing protein [Nitrospiraceae bacterium]|nr:putative Ig domain-containing protein [Nitrospiraceae bacterium]